MQCNAQFYTVAKRSKLIDPSSLLELDNPEKEHREQIYTLLFGKKPEEQKGIVQHASIFASRIMQKLQHEAAKDFAFVGEVVPLQPPNHPITTATNDGDGDNLDANAVDVDATLALTTGESEASLETELCEATPFPTPNLTHSQPNPLFLRSAQP